MSLPDSPDATHHSRLSVEPSSASAIRILNVLLRRRRTLLLCLVLLPGATFVSGVLRPRTYTSVATFAPQQSSGRGEQSLAGLAAQFGVAVGSADNSQSPSFYADLLRSHDLLRAVAESSYTAPDGRRRPLPDVVAPAVTSSIARLEATVVWLRDLAIHVDVAPRTGMLTMRVTAASATMARELASHLLTQLTQFNVTTRQSRAAAERAFTERRLEEARAELRAAEDRLQSFLQANRGGLDAPELRFRYDRLNRDVELRQQIYTSLSQSYEQSRIDQVRDTPVFTVIDQPTLALRPDARGIVMRTLYALIAGMMLGVALALIIDTFSPGSSGNPIETLRTLRREIWGELLHPWRLLRFTLRKE